MSIDVNSIQVEEWWKNVLRKEFEQPYFEQIKDFLVQEKKLWKVVYPEGKNIFGAFNSTPFDKVKVVIIGQDPYHGPWQAHGLCFSVQHGTKSPPSLKNIYKELHDDIWFEIPDHGCLQKRADQWVFLLNAILTVEARNAASHSRIWWQQFTDHVIQKLSKQKEGLVFLLRWAFAQGKKELIDVSVHHILEAPHPSPFSANRGFFGCKHFSKTNKILISENKSPIDRSI